MTTTGEGRSHRAKSGAGAERKGRDGPQSTQRKVYIPVRLLGEGTFGVVIQAKVQGTGEDVAIKRVRYDARLQNRELVIMRDILGPGPSQSGVSRPRRAAETSGRNSDTSGSHAASGEAGTHDVLPFTESGESDGASSRHSSASEDKSGSGRRRRHEPTSTSTMSAPPFLTTHPNLVQLLNHYFSTDPDTGEYHMNLVMSYLPMDLQAARRRAWAALNLSPPGPKAEAEMLLWARVILFQLARALTFLHAKHVCHRDVKPGNILLDPDTGRVRLGDFGSAKQLHHAEKNVSYICSRHYRAPELLFGALHYGCEVDLWSLGCIVAELLRPRGETLFKGVTTVDQMAEIFKVLGAPSTEEMYAMNPQCAEAMLYTDRMYYPPAPTTANDACDRHVGHSGMATPSGKERAGDGARHGYDTAHETTDDVGRTAGDYFEYYRVLKIRAMRWKDVLATGVPGEGVDLVARLLCYVPGKRLSAAGVVEHAFFHPLFSCGAQSEGGDGDRAAVSPVRLPNGRLLPLEMFTLTEAESRLYSLSFQMKMAREAECIRAAAAR